MRMSLTASGSGRARAGGGCPRGSAGCRMACARARARSSCSAETGRSLRLRNLSRRSCADPAQPCGRTAPGRRSHLRYRTHPPAYRRRRTASPSHRAVARLHSPRPRVSETEIAGRRCVLECSARRWFRDCIGNARIRRALPAAWL